MITTSPVFVSPESYFVRTILKDGCKISYYALPLHRENVGSMGFSNEHDVASQHSLTYLKREVIGVIGMR